MPLSTSWIRVAKIAKMISISSRPRTGVKSPGGWGSRSYPVPEAVLRILKEAWSLRPPMNEMGLKMFIMKRPGLKNKGTDGSIVKGI
jgi:hypothetical protein